MEYLKQVTLTDEWGPVHFYLVPFIRPGHVRHLFDTNGYTDAFQKLLARETIRKQERNVVLAHQFFVWNGQNPETCDSETAVLTSGGLDAIDASVLEPFEYAALGHIHGAQKVGQERFRYCGTPYKYSISEEHHQKGITVVELAVVRNEIRFAKSVQHTVCKHLPHNDRRFQSLAAVIGRKLSAQNIWTMALKPAECQRTERFDAVLTRITV